MKYLIDLEPEQVEQLVRQDLKWHLVNSDLDSEELMAMEIVLQYYSVPQNEVQ